MKCTGTIGVAAFVVLISTQLRAKNQEWLEPATTQCDRTASLRLKVVAIEKMRSQTRPTDQTSRPDRLARSPSAAADTPARDGKVPIWVSLSLSLSLSLVSLSLSISLSPSLSPSRPLSLWKPRAVGGAVQTSAASAKTRLGGLNCGPVVIIQT